MHLDQVAVVGYASGMPTTRQKLYAYVDESGQDTLGAMFVVGVVVLESERDRVLRQLEDLEQRSGKHRKKWRRARQRERQVYIEQLAQLPSLRDVIFCEVFSGQTKYIELTAYTRAKAVLRRVKGDYRATIFVDG